MPIVNISHFVDSALIEILLPGLAIIPADMAKLVLLPETRSSLHLAGEHLTNPVGLNEISGGGKDNLKQTPAMSTDVIPEGQLASD